MRGRRRVQSTGSGGRDAMTYQSEIVEVAAERDALAARLAEAEALLQWVDDQGRLDAHDVFDFREMHAKYKARLTDSAAPRETASHD
jgi:hypothetical protein